MIKRVLVDWLGRASVPALSLVSGFLIVPSLLKYGYAALARERFRALIVPMVFWNLLIIGLSVAILIALGHKTSPVRALDGQSAWEILLFKAISLNYAGATTALNFLRDAFVCALLSPLLVLGARRGSWLFVALVWVWGLSIGFAPVVYRPSILMFFSAGVLVADRGMKLTPPSWLCAISLALFGAIEWVSSHKAPGIAWELVGWSRYPIICIAFSAIVLAISSRLSGTRFGNHLVRFEPSIYLAFLGHSVFFLLAWGTWQKIFGADLNFPYHLFFLASPAAWMFICVWLLPLLRGWPAWLQVVVRGKSSVVGMPVGNRATGSCVAGSKVR